MEGSRGYCFLSACSIIIIKAALVCLSSDTPATQKTCGFLAHSAFKRCFKYLKAFPTLAFGTMVALFKSSKNQELMPGIVPLHYDINLPKLALSRVLLNKRKV